MLRNQLDNALRNLRAVDPAAAEVIFERLLLTVDLKESSLKACEGKPFKYFPYSLAKVANTIGKPALRDELLSIGDKRISKGFEEMESRPLGTILRELGGKRVLHSLIAVIKNLERKEELSGYYRAPVALLTADFATRVAHSFKGVAEGVRAVDSMLDQPTLPSLS